MLFVPVQMVANAGVLHTVGPFTDCPVENWDAIFSVNARGVFLCFKHAAKRMVEQGRGGRLIGAFFSPRLSQPTGNLNLISSDVL